MKKKFLITFLFITVVILGVCVNCHPTASAAQADTATLRILATGDLHGQTTAYDYETNLGTPNNGLSKIATMIQQNRNAVGVDNTLLVDAGDLFYDYTSNYFYDNDKNEIQPILRAIKIMNYDYITLGNHEFDYPLDYLNRQLKDSGLLDKVLVCNAIWHDSGKQVFHPSAVITKNLTTSGGNSVEVKIGVIGSTTNSISTRRGDYVNEIDALNNYSSIVTEANRLKAEEKVDLVVVILHGGIGNKSTSTQSDNIGYALTLVDSIDAIVTGHTHEIFPDSTASALTSNSVNQSTGCINGTPVVATKSHARTLGTIDLSLEVSSEGSVTLASSQSSIQYVTANTLEDSSITAMFRPYQKMLKAGADATSYPIANGITYHNYDTVLQDSNLFQLFNNAKIAYGLTYVAEYLPAYKNVPIIACTRNLLDSNEAYVMMKDTLSSSKISRLLSESSPSRPSGYIQLYEITGKELREWLEYNSSIYATEGTIFKSLLKNYVSRNKGVSTLLNENYVYQWNNQYIFDGITYTVDLTKKARYTSGGTLINSLNKRITSLTYNGVKVTDNQKFILVADSGLPSLSFLPRELEDSVKTVKDYAVGKNITLDYIKDLSAFGAIAVKADRNWSLTASKSYTFLLGIPKKYVTTVSGYSWNQGLAAATTSYSFLKGIIPSVSQDINVVVSQGRTQINNNPVPVIISTTSKYAIKGIKYLSGKIKKTTDAKWNSSGIVKNNTFTTQKNGVYTVLVTDSNNNRSIAYITVDCYDANILPTPVPDRLTNRNSNFTGSAVPNSTLHVTIGGANYQTTVKSNGTFDIAVTPPKAFSSITSYVAVAGKKSATVTAAVRKTGPDAVTMDKISFGDTYVTGTTDADTFVYALIWSTIYVGQGQTSTYKNSDFYHSTYKIVETKVSVNQETGAYQLQLPAFYTSRKVFVFSIDRFGITSKSTMLMVQ